MTKAFVAVAWLGLAFAAAESAAADTIFSLTRASRSFDLGIGGIAALADGSYLYSDQTKKQVLRVGRDGTRSSITTAPFNRPGQLLVQADGSVLVADNGVDPSGAFAGFVRRVAPDGTMSTVAGGGPPPSQRAPGDLGDGGHATQAWLPAAADLAPAPDGGFVVADGSRLRHVAPGGTISTIAGNGAFGPYAGEGGPALEATLDGLRSVAAEPGGGFLIVVQNRVVRLDAGGTVRTVAGTGLYGPPRDGEPAIDASLTDAAAVAVDPAGGFVIAEAQIGRFRRVSPDGQIRTLAGTGTTSLYSSISRAGFFIGDGRDARRALLRRAVDAVPDPLGGWLIADTDRVSMVTGGAPPRMAIAITGGDLAGPGLRYVVTAAGRVELQVRRGRATVGSSSATANPGRNFIRVPRVRPGFYRLLLRAQGPAGADDDRLAVLLGGRLPYGAAVNIIEGQPEFQDARHARDGQAGASDASPYSVGECRRMTKARVDCVVDEGEYCSSMYSLRLRRNGLLYEREYPCGRPRFRRQPAHLSQGFPLPLY